jgi:hypothetical protein
VWILEHGPAFSAFEHRSARADEREPAKKHHHSRSGKELVQLSQLTIDHLDLVLVRAVEAVEPDAMEVECESVSFGRGVLQIK